MGRQHHCSNCATSFHNLEHIDDPNPPYYPLGQRSLICRRCVDKLVETRIGGLLKMFDDSQTYLQRGYESWSETARAIVDIMAFDVATMPESTLRCAVEEVQKLLKEAKV